MRSLAFGFRFHCYVQENQALGLVTDDGWKDFGDHLVGGPEASATLQDPQHCTQSLIYVCFDFTVRAFQVLNGSVTSQKVKDYQTDLIINQF